MEGLAHLSSPGSVVVERTLHRGVAAFPQYADDVAVSGAIALRLVLRLYNLK